MNLLFWLTVKHFICDFPLQMTPWMYRNKGIYMHVGGVVHALIHAIGTLLVFEFAGPSVPWLGACAYLIDFAAHYHIDWAKMNIGAHFNLKPDNSEWFWVLLGFDQFLHAMTYFGLVALAGVWV